MRRRLLHIISGVVGLTVGLGTAATAGVDAAAPGVDGYDLALLRTNEVEESQASLLPESLDLANLADGELDAATLRLVASTDEGEFFVALNAARELCFILVAGGDDWAAASACSSPGDFNDHGIGLRLQSRSTILEGYLVSDSAAASVAKSDIDGLSRAVGATNALIFDAETPEEQRAEIRDALLAEKIGLIPGEPK